MIHFSLKKLIAGALLAAVFCFCGFSEAESQTENSAVSDGVSQNFNIYSDPEDIPLNFGNDVSAETPSSAGSFGPGVFIRVIFSLAVVAALIYGVYFFFKKVMKTSSPSDDPFLRKICELGVAPGKSVQIVTVQDKGYVIGVTDQNINLLGEIDDEQLLNAMNLYADEKSKTPKPKSFAEILNLFMPGSSEKSSGNSAASSAENSFDVLKAQSARLDEE